MKLGRAGVVGTSAIVVSGVAFWLIFQQQELALSFYLPFLVGAATFMFVETIRWYRGSIDAFDPGAMLGIVSMFFLLVSPVLQVAWDYWPFLPALTKSDGWIFSWAFINFIGAFLYFYVVTSSRFSKKKWFARTSWQIVPSRFYLMMPLALLICFVAQLYVYASFGGVGGFIETFTDRQMEGVQDEDPFEGMGFIMLVAESFKLLFAIFAIYWLSEKKWAHRRSVFLLAMFLFFIAFLFFGGLRGSRSSTLFALFFAGGMYHFYIRKISAKTVVAGILVSIGFLTTYYWYKIAGLEGIAAITDASARTEFHSARQDAVKYIIARDLGRMDIQVLALQEMSQSNGPDFAWGRTYATALFSVVPKQFLPYKPDQITKEKTEILYGRGAYDPNGPRQTTLVLGQFGEAFVNFSYFGPFLFFLLIGIIVVKVRQYSENLPSRDARLFLLPILCLFPTLLMITDFNVIVQQIFRYALIPVIMLLIVSRRCRVRS